MKKLISLTMICALVGLSAFGCADTNTDKNNTYYRGYSSPYSFDTNDNGTMTKDNKGTTGTEDYLGYNRSNEFDFNNYNTDTNDLMDNSKNNSTTGLASDKSESSIKNLVTKDSNVDDCSVAINDDSCYVGLDTKNNQNISEKTKEQLSTEIKRLNPDINKVYFSSDKNTMNKIMNAVKDRTKTDWNEIENLFR